MARSFDISCFICYRQSYLRALLLVVSICLLHLRLVSANKNERFYKVHEQFIEFNGTYILPKIVLFTIYMGKLKYPHVALLLESMRWNPMVDFKLINIIKAGSGDSDSIIELKKRQNVENFYVITVTLEEFRERVKDRLGLDIPYTYEWYYKMCDYKPVIGHLFPELIYTQKSSNGGNDTSPYKYWGYGDMDLIWGNFSRFAHWFQGQPFVITGSFYANGVAQFMLTEDWSYRLMLNDPLYLPLLRNLSYHNLDEMGTQVDQRYVIELGTRSMGWKVMTWADQHHQPLNRGKDKQYDRPFMDEGDSVEYGGPVRWFRGTLQTVRGSKYFPPNRELLLYHRPVKDLNIPMEIRDDMFADMIKYGYLLPSWIPLCSRFMHLDTMTRTASTLDSLTQFKPFTVDKMTHLS